MGWPGPCTSCVTSRHWFTSPLLQEARSFFPSLCTRLYLKPSDLYSTKFSAFFLSYYWPFFIVIAWLSECSLHCQLLGTCTTSVLFTNYNKSHHTVWARVDTIVIAGWRKKGAAETRAQKGGSDGNRTGLLEILIQTNIHHTVNHFST